LYNEAIAMNPDPVPGRLEPGSRLVALAALLLAGFCGASPQAARAGSPVGINIYYAGDWAGDLLFADAFKESRGWTGLDGSSTVAVDANGWPTEDAETYVWAGQTLDMSGTYALSFNGQATVTCTGGTVTNVAYNAAANQTTATVTMSNTDLNMAFKGTQRTASSGAGTGVTNVKLMRPTSYGASTSYPTSATFTTLIEGLVEEFGTVRFMDYLATNGNLQVNWSDRVPPTYATYVVYDPSYGWEGRGSPWEFAVQLCNETNTDMWINIPVGATDAYVTNVANLIAYGSDGTNPYTSAQASPAYPPLNPALRVYVEFSNEVWNTGFVQAATNHASAQAEVAAGGSPLNFDGDTNDWNWAARRTAKRTVEIGNLFRGVFGNAAMMTRIRPVLESQEGYTSFWLMQQVHMLEDYYNNPAQVSDPHPPSYYVYGGGGSAYYNPDDSSPSLTLTSIWSSETFDVTQWAPICQSDSDYDLPVYGMRVAYEGGPSMDDTGNSESIKSEAWGEPQMTTCVFDHQTTWDQNGGGLLCYYDSTGGYEWGFTLDPAVLDTAKLEAIDQVNSSPAAVGTYGTAIPGTVTASAYTSPETWAGVNPASMSAGAGSFWTWTGYVVNTATTRVFSVGLSAGSEGTGNTADLYVDGTYQGTVSIPNTGSNSTFQSSATLQTGVMTAGTHGFLLKASAGSFGVNTITFSAASGPLPAVTAQPVSVTVSGGTVALSFAASGASAYQWMLNGQPVPGATGPTLLLSDAAAATGSYTCVAANSAGAVTSNAATVALAETSNPGRLTNLSCRAGAGTGSNELITGFEVGGQGTSGQIPVLVRASGPVLENFGLTGVLPDPELTLDQSAGDGTNTLLVADTGWGGSPEIAAAAVSVGAFSWGSEATPDSAVVDSLQGGAFTAQIVGASGDTGVALAEVYDATPPASETPASPRLTNLSARVLVGSGANILIAGFEIGGTTAKTVLIRASGPALKPFGVTGVLADPELLLFQSNSDGTNTLLQTNTGWGGNPQIAAIAAQVGAFGWGSAATPDSAILVTRPPGAYTAEVEGASGDTGVALVEVYEVD
jgi:hypothetical protein